MTTNPQHLLFFGEDWGRHPSTAQYLALELLDDYTVTWINSIGLREPSLSKADFNRVLGKIRRGKAPAQVSRETRSEAAATAPEPRAPQHLLSPWIVPFHRLTAVQHLNSTLFRRQLGQLTHLHNSPYSVVTANPASYYLLDQLRPTRSLYYCADKYAQIAGLNPTLVERFERELLTRVDTVVATSKPLVDDLSKHHNNVHYLPHGVDFARFNSTLAQPPAKPGTGRSTIGFIGLLGEHIDFELIAASAVALPDHRFLFVGPVEDGVTLPKGDNIEYVGSVPQHDLPGYIARMDVCTLPYARSERNHYANPTKVREYLAAGRAVVATRQPGLLDIPGAVSVVDDTSQYIAALSRRLSELAGLDERALSAHREAIAAPMEAETWGARALALRGLLG